jgi:hypothetical protein
MEDLDKRDFDNCILVIPWNDADAETSTQRDLLVQAIHAVFLRKARRREPCCFVDTPASASELKDELARSLVAARSRILESGSVRRRAESEGVFVLPRLVATPPGA